MRRDSKGSWIQSCRRQEGITYFISVVEKVNGVKSQLLSAVGSSRVFLCMCSGVTKKLTVKTDFT